MYNPCQAIEKPLAIGILNGYSSFDSNPLELKIDVEPPKKHLSAEMFILHKNKTASAGRSTEAIAIISLHKLHQR
jgi:hypothetical protein